MATRFATPFLIAYDSLIGKPASGSDLPGTPAAGKADIDGGGPAASAEQETDSLNPHKDKIVTPYTDGSCKQLQCEAFRKQCERKCEEELEARTVAILAEGGHVDIRANLTTTRLYQNLGSFVKKAFFYDC